MHSSKGYFIEMMAAFLDGRAIELNDCDWNEVFEYADKNDLLGALYVVLKDKGDMLSTDLNGRVKNIFLAVCKVGINIEYALDTVKRLFNENGITFVILKGGMLRDLYPVKELRTMGDIDVLIKPEDLVRADKVLKANGFLKDEQYSLNDVWDYKFNGVLLELHGAIVSEDLLNGADYKEFFAKPFEHTFELEGYRLEFECEYNFAYLLTHMAKHFSTTGCGIRMYMDIAVFVKKFGEDIDWNRTFDMLRGIKLDKFASITLGLCKMWFGTKFDYNIADIDNEYYNELEDYIISGGVFGFDNDVEGASNIIRSDYRPSDNKFVDFCHRVRSFMQWLFPSDEYMRFRYGWYAEKAKWYLPIAWVRRFVSTFRSKGGVVFENAKKTANSGEDVKKQYEFLKKSGLV